MEINKDNSIQDKEDILKLLQKSQGFFKSIALARPEIADDQEIVLSISFIQGNFPFISQRLRKDLNFMFSYLCKNRDKATNIWTQWHERKCATKEFALALIKEIPHIYVALGVHFQRDVDIISIFLENTHPKTDAFKKLNTEIRENKSIFLELLKRKAVHALQAEDFFTTRDYKQDADFIVECIKYDINAFSDCSWILKKDPKFYREAILANPDVISRFSNEQCSNYLEMVSLAIEHGTEFHFLSYDVENTPAQLLEDTVVKALKERSQEFLVKGFKNMDTTTFYAETAQSMFKNDKTNTVLNPEVTNFLEGESFALGRSFAVKALNDESLKTLKPQSIIFQDLFKKENLLRMKINKDNKNSKIRKVM